MASLKQPPKGTTMNNRTKRAGLARDAVAVFTAVILASVAAGYAPMAGAADTVDGAAKPVRFVQDRFAVGFWVDPPLDERADERYQEIADANFTMIIGSSAGADPKAMERQLALCAKHDLKAVLFYGGLAPADLPTGPACWGYALRDEPCATDFPALRAQVDGVRQARPGMLAYINLFPNYATAAQQGTATYDEYVSRFLNEVGVDVLSMDHYPVFKPDQKDGRDNYCVNLGVMRAHSQAAGVPFWNFFNTMPYGPQTDPTEDQLRWQIYASLSYGAKGVLYFCYYTPVSPEFPKGGAIIARDGQRTRHWEQARLINAGLKNLGPVLMKLTSTEVRRVTPECAPAEALKDTPIRDITRDAVDPPNDYLVGVFRHEDGRRAVMLMNYRFAYTAWPTVDFDTPAEQVKEVDKATAQEIAVRDDSPEMPGVQVSLDAGEGRLFLMPQR
jgi:hypothetical protein